MFEFLQMARRLVRRPRRRRRRRQRWRPRATARSSAGPRRRRAALRPSTRHWPGWPAGRIYLRCRIRLAARKTRSKALPAYRAVWRVTPAARSAADLKRLGMGLSVKAKIQNDDEHNVLTPEPAGCGKNRANAPFGAMAEVSNPVGKPVTSGHCPMKSVVAIIGPHLERTTRKTGSPCSAFYPPP